MICAPNEKEGRKLLDEIMQGGNFAQYDEREKELKNGSLVPFPIAEPIPRRKIGIATRKQNYKTASMEKFMQMFCPVNLP